jgi:CRP/FNR family transcriptional regulator, cyclic AMP receptor protein
MPILNTKVSKTTKTTAEVIAITTAAKPSLKPMTKVVPKPRLTVVLQTLADLGVQRSYRKGAVILNDAEVGDAVYILIQGRVRVYGAAPTGKEITYGTIEAGEYFGEMALDGGTRSASIEAMEPCLCSVVPNAQVLAFMRDHSDFAVDLLHKAIGRARSATGAARDMALLDVYERLAQSLNRLTGVTTEENGFPRTLENLITHAELAAQIGASREMVSKLMKDLERGGYISVENRQITLLKKLPARW